MTRTMLTIEGVGYWLEETQYLNGMYAVRMSTEEREFLTYSQLTKARFYGKVEDDD